MTTLDIGSGKSAIDSKHRPNQLNIGLPGGLFGGVPGDDLDEFLSGSIHYFPAALGNLPAGFLHCDGSYVLREQYPALFAVIGTMYGTTDISNFRLPLYDGYFLRFCDFGSGLDPANATRTDRGDGQVGAAVGTVQQHAILAHTHVVRTPAVVGGSIGLTTRGAHTNAYGTAGASTGVGVENRPKNINMYAVIKI